MKESNNEAKIYSKIKNKLKNNWGSALQIQM